jgi:hypothetical protein
MFADTSLLLGDKLLTWLVLALAGAFFVGNLGAVLKPPPEDRRQKGDLERAPVGRSLAFAGLGLLVALWALASLVVT